jgi:hypothetical protein
MANKPLSPKSLEILKALESGTFTMADLKDQGIADLNSANFTALVNRGLIASEQIVVEVPTVVKRKVNAYTLTDKGANFKAE